MKKETLICEHCGQSAFIDMFYPWKEKQVCHECYTLLMNDLYSWDNPNLAIKLDIGSDYSDYETIYVPFKENIENDNRIDFDQDTMTVEEAFQELEKTWTRLKWGYYGNAQDIELVSMKDIAPDIDIEDTVLCSEFDIYIYKEWAYHSDLYDRPFDSEPNDMLFSSRFAEDCMKGDIYSKDFRYAYCEDCGRYVCEQNPSNGWHSQGHYETGEFECNKCYEERTLENGINDDFDGNSIPGQFYDTEDLELNNWNKEGDYSAGHGYSDYTDPSSAISRIQNLIDSGLKVLINYEHMSIGGLGGYFSIWTKQ